MYTDGAEGRAGIHLEARQFQRLLPLKLEGALLVHKLLPLRQAAASTAQAPAAAAEAHVGWRRNLGGSSNDQREEGGWGGVARDKW
jgi:hypothetical protein